MRENTADFELQREVRIGSFCRTAGVVAVLMSYVVVVLMAPVSDETG
jgi:hypothetical protein